jgi:hypothetical protein
LLKETFGQLWSYRREAWARRFFEHIAPSAQPDTLPGKLAIHATQRSVQVSSCPGIGHGDRGIVS